MKLFTNLKSKISTLLVATAITFGAGIANAETLMASQIEVNDDVVRLGDIFNVKGIFASEELFQAPPLGRKGVLTETALQQIANKYSIEWKNENNFAKITIARKAMTIDEPLLKNIIFEYAVNNQHIAGNVGQTNIKFATNFADITIAASDYANLTITDFIYRPYSDQFSVNVRYIQNGAYRGQKLSGKIENMLRVPVLARNIRRDQIINPSDVKFIQINSRRVVENIILDTQDIIGKSAKNNIRAMQPIGEHLLKYADLVKKNDLINLTFKLGRINLSLKARALSTGAEGAIIRVMNLKSGKQIDAIVTGKDQAMTINSNQTNAKIALNN